jgi:hypothetical protein
MLRSVVMVWVYFASGIIPAAINFGLMPVYILWNIVYLLFTSSSILYLGRRLGHTLALHAPTIMVGARGSMLTSSSGATAAVIGGNSTVTTGGAGGGAITTAVTGTAAPMFAIGRYPSNANMTVVGSTIGNGTRTLRSSSDATRNIPPSPLHRSPYNNNVAAMISPMATATSTMSATSPLPLQQPRSGSPPVRATGSHTNNGVTVSPAAKYRTSIIGSSSTIAAIATAVSMTPHIDTDIYSNNNNLSGHTNMVISPSSLLDVSNHDPDNVTSPHFVAPSLGAVATPTTGMISLQHQQHYLSSPGTPPVVTSRPIWSTDPQQGTSSFAPSPSALTPTALTAMTSITTRRHTYNINNGNNNPSNGNIHTIATEHGSRRESINLHNDTLPSGVPLLMVSSSSPLPLRVTPLSPTVVGSSNVITTSSPSPNAASIPSSSSNHNQNGTAPAATTLSLMRSASRSHHWLTSRPSSLLQTTATPPVAAESIPPPLGRPTSYGASVLNSSGGGGSNGMNPTLSTSSNGNGVWGMNALQRKRLALISRIRRLALTSACCGYSVL